MTLIERISNFAADIGAEIKALKSRSVKSLQLSASATVNLIAGGTQDVIVNFGQTLPHTNYAYAVRVVAGASVLGALEVVDPAKTKAADKLILTLKNTALVTLGASVKLQVTVIYIG